MKQFAQYVKRLVDILSALVALILFFPVLVLIAVLIKLDSPGDAIYRSKRVGKDGRIFTLYKLRSMVAGAEDMLKNLAHLNQGGPFMIKITDDPRVTPVGKFLRKYSLDELPQLWNVLKGDMSLVGPRPQVPNEVALYNEEQKRRLTVLPGITGLWQVSRRSDPRFEVWVAQDLEYIDHWSLWLDLKIMIKTIGVVLAGKDASPKPACLEQSETQQ